MAEININITSKGKTSVTNSSKNITVTFTKYGNVVTYMLGSKLSGDILVRDIIV